MNVYFDLTLVAILLLSMVGLYFVKLIGVYRVKRGFYVPIILSELASLYLIYLSPVLIFIIKLFLYLIFFGLAYKKKMLKALILYKVCIYGIVFILCFFDSNIKYYRFTLVLSSVDAFKTLLFIPCAYLGLYLSVRLVDSLYHLKNYKLECIISFQNKKKILKGYYDTGNVLKYKNVPVIFLCKDSWPNLEIEASEYESIDVGTLNEEKQYKAFKALISLEDKEEEYFIYIVLIERISSFNGCECLLNAYLM